MAQSAFRGIVRVVNVRTGKHGFVLRESFITLAAGVVSTRSIQVRHRHESRLRRASSPWFPRSTGDSPS